MRGDEFLPPHFTEDRGYPHHVSHFTLPDGGVVAFDPRIPNALFMSLWACVFDAWRGREFAPKPRKEAA